MTAILLTLIFVLGASVGSFLNVVIYRLPAGLSLIKPRSRCPHCLHPLGAKENVPVFGWIWLKGRCFHCHAPISPRYPLIEAMVGFLFLASFWQFGWTWDTVTGWLLLSWLVALAWIDLDTFILPNELTQSGLILGVLSTFLTHHFSLDILLDRLEGVVLGYWLFEIIRIVGTLILRKPAMGKGDAKLSAMLGAWLGWKLVLFSSFLACLIGSLLGVIAIGLGWVKRQQPIPFGPFLVLGAILTLFWGQGWVNQYQQLFNP